MTDIPALATDYKQLFREIADWVRNDKPRHVDGYIRDGVELYDGYSPPAGPYAHLLWKPLNVPVIDAYLRPERSPPAFGRMERCDVRGGGMQSWAALEAVVVLRDLHKRTVGRLRATFHEFIDKYGDPNCAALKPVDRVADEDAMLEAALLWYAHPGKGGTHADRLKSAIWAADRARQQSEQGPNEARRLAKETERLNEEVALEEAGLNFWIPMAGADAALLGKLGEELNEAGAAAARCLIQGIGESEPVTGKPNRQWLEEEIADVMAMFDLAVERFDLYAYRIGNRRDDKKRRKKIWLDALDRMNGKDSK